ncbi:hypothetical protein D0Z00_003235 [Geotrichum galactomycetum]|uniref:Uncharacterized protein n=1 Tax=Geotrichum galactomycetum TaxID=27317 RepID=A0ACB6V1Y9_9ASCO|nr:hypothetical protein D0Z00_003235 [Geotrichum candidum]
MTLNHRIKVKTQALKLKNVWVQVSVILAWFIALQFIALLFFKKGFLLSRPVLSNHSECAILPFDSTEFDLFSNDNLEKDSCWTQKSFDRAVIVVIDALRFDFVMPNDPSNDNTDLNYLHSFPFLYEQTQQNPQNSLLLKFIADPPTTTLQRLKGLTTGSLPTFIDAGSNFAGTEIDEDNWIGQLAKLNKSISFIGDDTWMALFAPNFNSKLTHPYESLNVKDLHTVDNGVIEHLFPILENTDETDEEWDVTIGHLLGVDHAGHRYGPNHSEMKKKLEQMNSFIQDVVNSIEDDTLLIVMGDHGMDPKGDHGGESLQEVESTLWMYSKTPFFGRLENSFYNTTAYGENHRSVNQIDLVSTISLLLGLPVPFNNLGFPIIEAFLGPESDDLRSVAKADFLTAAQIHKYTSTFGGMLASDAAAEKLWEEVQQYAKEGKWNLLVEASTEYQKYVLEECHVLWVNFDVVSMVIGITLLAFSAVMIYVYARVLPVELDSIYALLLKTVSSGASTFGLAFWVASRVIRFPFESPAYSLGLGIAVGIIVGYFGVVATILFSSNKILHLLFAPKDKWSIVAFAFTILHVLTFTSNSFVNWEDGTLSFLVTTMGFIFLIYSLQNLTDDRSKVMAAYFSLLIMGFSRLSALIRVCREEQGATCITTFYENGTSTASFNHVLILGFVSLILPSTISSFYTSTANFNGSASVWISYGLRIAMFMTTMFWGMDIAENKGWVGLGPALTAFKEVKVLIARILFGVTLFAANYAWYRGALCVKIDFFNNGNNSGQKVQARILGYSNIYGSTLFLVLINFFGVCLIASKPLAGVSLSLLLVQILALLEILDLNDLYVSPIGPISLGLLGASHFFTTGHQATVPSIQWDAGFIPAESIVFPLTHAFILFNTFGSQILVALAVPLVALWKISPSKEPSSLLTITNRASCTLILYQTVVTLSSMIFAMHFRRHLMIWKIFAPRFMLAALSLGVTDIAVFLGVAVFAGKAVSYINQVFNT